MRLHLLLIPLLICSVAFSQKASLKCKKVVKASSSCPIKSSSLADAAGEIVSACKKSSKNEITLAQAKAAVESGMTYVELQSVESFEENLKVTESALTEYQEGVKILENKISNYEELKAAYSLKRDPLIEKRKELENAMKSIADKTTPEYNNSRNEWYSVTKELRSLYDSPDAIESSKEQYESRLKSSNQYLSNLEIQRKQYVEKIEVLKKTSKEELDKLFIKDVKEKIAELGQQMRSADKYRDCGFSDYELAAIGFYSGSGYIDINQALREKKSSSASEIQPVIDAINSGLDKIANHTGLVKRGVDLPEAILAAHCIGCIVTYRAFTSTSKEKGFSGEQSFVISSKNGKYIAPLSSSADEEEVLFKSNTKFKVLNKVGNRFTLVEVD